MEKITVHESSSDSTSVSIWELKLRLYTVRSQSFMLPNNVIGRCLARHLDRWIHSWCKSKGSVQLSPSSCGVLPWGYVE